MADIRRRDELPDRERAVSDALDELNHAMHGLTASWAYPVEFLEMLAERGFTVVPQRDARAVKALRIILDSGKVPSEWAVPWRERAERAEALLADRAQACPETTVGILGNLTGPPIHHRCVLSPHGDDHHKCACGLVWQPVTDCPASTTGE